jgi:hypothetical protein
MISKLLLKDEFISNSFLSNYFDKLIIMDYDEYQIMNKFCFLKLTYLIVKSFMIEVSSNMIIIYCLMIKEHQLMCLVFSFDV